MAHHIEDVELSDKEEYDEDADEDFNPEAEGAKEEVSSSSDEEETTAKPTTKQHKKRKSEGLDNHLDSGDEATIQEQRRKKKRRRKDDAAPATAPATGADDDDSDGGLIKTRAQRLAEKIEKKHRKRGTRDGEVTIDVEEAWSRLMELGVGRPTAHAAPEKGGGEEGGEANKENVDVDVDVPETETDKGGKADEIITIKRRIEYAGEVTEVEESVPRSSKEGQAYLATHPSADSTTTATPPVPNLLRPLKRPSLFEPNPTATIKGVPPEKLRPRAPSRFDVLMAEKRAEEERAKKAERMTTVQKSALDWRGFVNDSEGLREELDEYGKSKGRFLEREDFLGRAELARDVAARNARRKV